MLLSILFAVNLFAVVVGKYNVFENHTIELKYNEIAFFETPDFPVLHNSTKFFDYNVTFYTNETSTNGTRCVLVLQGLSYDPAPFSDVNDVYIFDISSFYLESYKYVLWFYNAYSGYVYFEEINDNCPFEMMSRDSPYNFTDENEIIFISSVYKNNTNFIGTSVTPNRINACKWQFIAPNDYGLKIFVQDFKITSSTSFRISNSTMLLLTENSAKSNRPYYYYDQYQHFEITLSKTNHFFANEVEFSAYISVVKQNVPKVDAKCVVSKSETDFSWSSSNLTEGYDNNVNCDYEVIVKNGSTILGFVEQYSVEPFVDNLIYYDDQYSYLLNLHYQFLLLPNINGSNKLYMFQFVSDGSVQASGFLIRFIHNACHCGDSDIVCNNGTSTVMEDSHFVCPDIECRFTILPCETAYSSLTITSSNFTANDNIKVLSNNVTIYTSASASLTSNGDVNVYLKSESNNTLVINSVTRRQKSISFSSKSFDLPPVDENIVLAEKGFSKVLDASVTSFAIIKTEKALAAQNVSIVIYGRNDLVCKNSFFTNESLTEMIYFKKCETSTAFYKCHTSTQKITYFHNTPVVNCFVAFSLSSNKNNCVFPSTVYFVQGDKSIVSVMSTKHGQCSITVLKEFGRYYSLTNIFTTSKANNVQIYFGANQETLFMEFNKYTFAKFTNTKMMSEVYAIKVPKGAILQMTFESVQLPVYEIVQAPYYSLVATPQYGMKRCFFNDDEAFISFNIGDIAATFTILEIRSSGNAFFQTNSETISVNKTGDVLSFMNQNVSFHFGTTTLPYCGCIMDIQAIKKLLV